MKKLVLLFSLVLVVGALLGTYYVGQYTEKKIKEIVSTSNNYDMQIEILSYERHFFTANVITKVSFVDENSKIISFKIFTKIHHYPYKALLDHKLIFSDKAVTENFKKYFATENWFNFKEDVNFLGTLRGKLIIPLGSYNQKGEFLNSQPLTIKYQINLNDYAGTMHLIWGGGVLKTHNTKIKLQDFTISSSFSVANAALKGAANKYSYSLRIGKLSQRNSQKNPETSLFTNISLNGGSENDSEKSLINTHNELKIDRWQFGNDVKFEFVNTYLKVDIMKLYKPAIDILTTDTQNHQEVNMALSLLVKHGFIFSIPSFYSQTPWGSIDGHLDFTLSKGSVLSNVISNPYTLLDYSEWIAKLSLPKLMIELPGIRHYLYTFSKNGLLMLVGQKIIFEGRYQQGQLVVNGTEIGL
ncbi:MAG: DUF945 family protein [Psychromonas sp.]|nr:DUF945 family protein [Psychromonas sp.]